MEGQGIFSVESHRIGDYLEVKLLDNGFHPFFKRRVRVDDRKAMRKLISDLKAKGVEIPISWFDDW